MSEERRQQRTYDHRLRELVRETGDLTIATRLGVPRSTAAGWLRRPPQDVVTLHVLELREKQLQAEVRTVHVPDHFHWNLVGSVPLQQPLVGHFALGELSERGENCVQRFLVEPGHGA